MDIHNTVFEYLKPTDEQMATMKNCREEFSAFASFLMETLPEGADKIYIMRRLRTTAMWCNVAITRNADGSPRA